MLFRPSSHITPSTKSPYTNSISWSKTFIPTATCPDNMTHITMVHWTDRSIASSAGWKASQATAIASSSQLSPSTGGAVAFSHLVNGETGRRPQDVLSTTLIHSSTLEATPSATIPFVAPLPVSPRPPSSPSSTLARPVALASLRNSQHQSLYVVLAPSGKPYPKNHAMRAGSCTATLTTASPNLFEKGDEPAWKLTSTDTEGNGGIWAGPNIEETAPILTRPRSLKSPTKAVQLSHATVYLLSSNSFNDRGRNRSLRNETLGISGHHFFLASLAT